MGVLFFGSEFDQHAWELAARLRKDFSGVEFLKTEDVNDLLRIKDNDVILDVARNIEEPTVLRIQDLKNMKIPTLHDMGLGSFLLQLEKIGRIRSVRIILVPEQADDSVISSLGNLLPKQENIIK